MTENKRQTALYAAFLKTINQVGLERFKQTTLFGRNDAIEEIADKKAA